MTPKQRSSAASIAADISWAKTPNRALRTAPGRDAVEQRFITMARELVGADASETDVLKAAGSLRKAHYKRMAQRSVESRRRNAATQK